MGPEKRLKTKGAIFMGSIPVDRPDFPDAIFVHHRQQYRGLVCGRFGHVFEPQTVFVNNRRIETTIGNLLFCQRIERFQAEMLIDKFSGFDTPAGFQGAD